MMWNEVELEIEDQRGRQIAKRSFVENEITPEITNLQVGDEVELEMGKDIHPAVVTWTQWGDYNIRGFFLQFKLRLC